MRVGTEAYFSGPLRRAIAGHAAVAPSWLVRFDHRTPVLDAMGLGASHSAEGPFLFGNPDRAAWALIAPDGPSDDDLRVMADLRSAWRGFLHDRVVGWPAVGARAVPNEHVLR